MKIFHQIIISIIFSSIPNIRADDNKFIQIYNSSKEVLVPRLAICNQFKDLFDNGVYLKTACFVHQGLAQDAARHKCAEYNMNLFIMNNEVVASHVMDAAQERYPSGSLFVNGKRQTLSRRWQIYNIDGSLQGPLNANIKFYSNRESGLCISISAKYTGIYNPLPRICTEKPWFICEHFQRTQNPPAIDTSQCRYRRDLYSNNIYLKSVCAVFESLNYDQGRRRCAGLGMNLFMFDTAEVDEAFFENTEDIMRTHEGFWWINGLRNPKTNEWSLYHANRLLKGPLYSGFEFVQLNGLNGISSGDCLLFSAHYGPHQGLGFSCDAKSAVFCEFIKN